MLYASSKITFRASFSAFMRSFSSFFRFSAEYSFRLFSFIIFSLIFLLYSFDVDDCSPAAVVAAFLLLPNEMLKNGLRDADDVDDTVDGGGCGTIFALDEVKVAAVDVVLVVFNLIAVAVDFEAVAAIAAAALLDVAVAMLSAGFSVGDTNARVLIVDFDLIGATFAVIPNFETADGVLVDIAEVLPNSGTVSRDDVEDADFDFCDVYEANLVFFHTTKTSIYKTIYK